MKKPKKHQFSHSDPETKITPAIDRKDAAVKPDAKDTVPDFVYRDLKRTGVIITGFIVMVVLLYGIQVRTDWFAPNSEKIRPINNPF